jgi:biopolymer transport protein ExbD
MAMKRWNGENQEAQGANDVNLTPLIDVSLALVVILLLATPLAFESSFAVRRAVDTGRMSAQETEFDRIEVAILGDHDVRVNRAVLAPAGLESALAPLLERSASGLVAVSCVDSVRHGTFVAVLDAIKLSGARDIAVVGR